MKKLALLALLMAIPVGAQVSNPSIIQATTEPATCPVLPMYYIGTSNLLYAGNGSGTCQQVNSGGGGSFNALTGDATSTSTGGATTVKGINGTLLSSLASCVLYNTTTTGAPSCATAAQAIAALGSTPAINASAMTNFPTFNQSTTNSAASLSISGQTALMTVTGLTSTNRVKTVRDAADTLLELGGSYTPTGTWVWTSASVTWPTFNQGTTGSAGSVANALTAAASGGAAAGSTYNGSAAVTFDYHSFGSAGLAASNTFTGSTTNDFSATSQFKLPVAAGYASAANGEIGYDTTNKNWHAWGNAVDNFLALFPAAGSYTNGHCPQIALAGGVLTLVDAGSACGSDSGGGTSGWSGTPLTFISSTTQYAPPVGGSLTSATESVADVASPVAQTISNLSVSLSAALGASATLQVTFRDGGVSQALTCTTAAGGASCTDSTHSFNIAKGDLIDFVLVSSGTVTAGVPQIVITYAAGTSSVGVTSIATTGPITGGTINSTGTIACATCVTSAASLINNALMTGAGSQASQTVTTGTGVLAALGVNTGTAGAFGVLIGSGSAAMNTAAVASGACETVVTVAAAGVATTDTISLGFNGDPTAVTGYGTSATGAVLSVYAYPTSGNVNVKVCNSTSASITPSALTLNFRVIR